MENKLTESINILNPENWSSIYADELFRYAMSKTGKAEVSEDLVQEAFLGALKAMGSFKGKSSERTWLFAILKFKIADHYRKASTKYEVNNSSFSFEDKSYLDNYFNGDGEWNDSSAPKGWGIDYSTSIENKELGNALNNCIDKLPENQRQLVLLKLVEEEETEKVCKELNITPTNYWVIIHRAKLQLRACLEKSWFKA
ncbi:MAG: sigma-70 family RNA polymerase sigma factor [Bacteroidetes bacterium]|nr:sigma-70 family RNA polymerase sigma factor [Bacteroidota bacterium]